MHVKPDADGNTPPLNDILTESRTLVVTDAYTSKLGDALARRHLDPATTVYLLVDAESYFMLKRKGLRAVLVQEILSITEVHDLNTEAVRMVRNRFFHDRTGRNVSQYRGVMLSDLYELFFLRPVLETVRNVAAVQKATRMMGNPHVLILGPGNLSRAARHVCASNGMSCERMRDGAFAIVYNWVRRILQMRRDRWPRSSMKDIFGEPILAFRVLVEAMAARIKGRLRPLPDKGCKTLIFSADGWSSVVYERLKGLSDWDFYVFGSDLFLRKKSFKHVKPLESHVSAGTVIELFSSLVKCLNIWLRLKRNARIEKRFMFQEVDLWPLLRTVLAPMVMVGFPWVAFQRAMAADALKALGSRKSVIIMPFDAPPVMRATLSAADVVGIPSVMLQHSLLGESIGQDRLHVGHYAAWGRRTLDWYASLGTKVSAFRITGNPRYDSLPLEKDWSLSDVPSIGLPSDKQIVLIALSGGEALSVSSTEAEDIFMVHDLMTAIELAGLSGRYHVAIKLHPRQNQLRIKRIFTEAMDDLTDVSFFDGNLHELLRSCDICVARYSTVLFEAMFFQRPCVVYDKLNKQTYVPYAEQGAAVKASGPEDMVFALKMLSDNDLLARMQKCQKEFINYCIGALDGRATDRVCAYIEEIAHGKSDN